LAYGRIAHGESNLTKSPPISNKTGEENRAFLTLAASRAAFFLRFRLFRARERAVMRPSRRLRDAAESVVFRLKGAVRG
jgi:hypothetical protein